jgi:8-oxo-dGTP pyrophosphatase MutT (NUDIX family)
MLRFSVILLVDPRGWILLQERDERPARDPEKWGFVGGHVDEGEEFEPAAYRELAEETGIVMAPGSLSLWLETTKFHEPSHADDVMQVWVGTTELTDADIVLGEGRQIVFVDPARVLELDLGQAPARVLPQFLDSDRYRELAQAGG